MIHAITFFETTNYYLIMSVVGWSLVIAQITIAVWLYRNLK